MLPEDRFELAGKYDGKQMAEGAIMVAADLAWAVGFDQPSVCPNLETLADAFRTEEWGLATPSSMIRSCGGHWCVARAEAEGADFESSW